VVRRAAPRRALAQLQRSAVFAAESFLVTAEYQDMPSEPIEKRASGDNAMHKVGCAAAKKVPKSSIPVPHSLERDIDAKRNKKHKMQWTHRPRVLRVR